jgi:glycosyltransferase involved in cell wall biosynthesis
VRIGITSGFDILLPLGGGAAHALNVSSILSKEYEIIYFPDPQFYAEYRRNSISLKRHIENLSQRGILLPKSFDEIMANEYDERRIIELYCDETIDFLFDFELKGTLFHEYPFRFIRSKNLDAGVLIQGFADLNFHLLRYVEDSFTLSILARSYRVFLYRVYHYLETFILLHKMESSRNISIVFIVNGNYERNVSISHPNAMVLSPSNGIMNDLLKASPSTSPMKRKGEKIDNKVLFFARLFYHKGLFDIPKILASLSESTRFKLVVAGRFIYAEDEKKFFDLLKKYGVSNSVEYKGYLSDEELYDEIRTAKVTLYPSHSDSFSMVVSQSLFFGTPVVAYDIAGLSIYKKFGAVKLVREFDFGGMADAVLEFLKMPDYEKLFDDPEMERFLRSHTWENVAEQYSKSFRSFKK